MRHQPLSSSSLSPCLTLPHTPGYPFPWLLGPPHIQTHSLPICVLCCCRVLRCLWRAWRKGRWGAAPLLEQSSQGQGRVGAGGQEAGQAEGLPVGRRAGPAWAARAGTEQHTRQMSEPEALQKCHLLLIQGHLPSGLPPLPCPMLVVNHYSRPQVLKHGIF